MVTVCWWGLIWAVDPRSARRLGCRGVNPDPGNKFRGNRVLCDDVKITKKLTWTRFFSWTMQNKFFEAAATFPRFVRLPRACAMTFGFASRIYCWRIWQFESRLMPSFS